ncbi:OsmC family protein [Clostridiaceae bacterium HSG29]|nr:OsmC family protein [Clostridiaceae bacterium HSG29]
MREPLNISINWKENMQFTATNDKTDYEVAIDVPFESEGGKKEGTTPKHLFLEAIAGCTGQIIIMFLKKMRAGLPTNFKIDITGKLTEDHPMYFKNIAITYYIDGDIDKNKMIKIIEKSETEYCGLTYTVGKLATIDTNIIFNGEKVS